MFGFEAKSKKKKRNKLIAKVKFNYNQDLISSESVTAVSAQNNKPCRLNGCLASEIIWNSFWCLKWARHKKGDENGKENEQKSRIIGQFANANRNEKNVRWGGSEMTSKWHRALSSDWNESCEMINSWDNARSIRKVADGRQQDNDHRLLRSGSDHGRSTAFRFE